VFPVRYKLYILLTQCIRVFRMVLTINFLLIRILNIFYVPFLSSILNKRKWRRLGVHAWLSLPSFGSQISAHLDYFSSFKTWKSNGFKSGEFGGHSVDVTNSIAASLVKVKSCLCA
jgi:hypothetical protein